MRLLGLGTSISHVTMATMPSSGFVLAIGGLNGTQWLHVVPTNVYAYTTLTSRLWRNLIVNLYDLQVIISWFGLCLEILAFQQPILISKRWNTKLHQTASWTRYEASALFYLIKPPIRPRDFQNWQGIINLIFFLKSRMKANYEMKT